MTERELTMSEAWEVACAVQAALGERPAQATNASVVAEQEAIDAALLDRFGILPARTDEYGRSDERHVWWVGQHEDGFVSGRWSMSQAENAVVLNLYAGGHGPLLWLVPDPDNTIHRRYYPKPATRTTLRVFPVTDGPIDEPPVEAQLFDLLGGEWADAS